MNIENVCSIYNDFAVKEKSSMKLSSDNRFLEDILCVLSVVGNNAELKNSVLNLSGSFLYMVYNHFRDDLNLIKNAEFALKFDKILVQIIEHNEIVTYDSRVDKYIDSELLISFPPQTFDIYDFLQIPIKKKVKSVEHLVEILTTGRNGRMFFTFLKCKYIETEVLGVNELLKERHKQIKEHMKGLKTFIVDVLMDVANLTDESIINASFPQLKQWGDVDLLFYDIYIDRISLSAIQKNITLNEGLLEESWRNKMRTLDNLIKVISFGSGDWELGKFKNDLMLFLSSDGSPIAKVCGFVNKFEDILHVIRRRHIELIVKPFVEKLMDLKDCKKLRLQIKERDEEEKKKFSNLIENIKLEKNSKVVEEIFKNLAPIYFDVIKGRRRLILKNYFDLLNCSHGENIFSLIFKCMGPVAQRLICSVASMALLSLPEYLKIDFENAQDGNINHKLNYKILWREAIASKEMIIRIGEEKLKQSHSKSSHSHEYYEINERDNCKWVIKIVRFHMKKQVREEINLLRKIMQRVEIESRYSDFIERTLQQMSCEFSVKDESRNMCELRRFYEDRENRVYVMNLNNDRSNHFMITEGAKNVHIEPIVTEPSRDRHIALQSFYGNWLSTALKTGQFHARLYENNMLFLASKSGVTCTVINFQCCSVLETGYKEAVSDFVEGLYHCNTEIIIKSLTILSGGHRNDVFNEKIRKITTYTGEQSYGELVTDIFRAAASHDRVFPAPFYEFMRCKMFMDNQMKESFDRLGDNVHKLLRGKGVVHAVLKQQGSRKRKGSAECSLVLMTSVGLLLLYYISGLS